MEKNKFEAPLMEIILINAADIITGSITCDGVECPEYGGSGGEI